jgi:hypothetical protein
VILKPSQRPEAPRRKIEVSKGSGAFVHPHQFEATFEQVITYLTDRDQLRSLPTEQYTASLARAYNAVNTGGSSLIV